MSIKQTITDKNKASEIDDHIRRSFDIKKVRGWKQTLSRMKTTIY